MTDQINSSNNAETLVLPSWFKIVAIIAFVWNLLGVIAFIGQMMMTPEVLAELSTAEQDIYANTPMWATVAFAVAVLAGALGSFFLWQKKALATLLLNFSLAPCVRLVVASNFS
jgi:hypothetical protein